MSKEVVLANLLLEDFHCPRLDARLSWQTPPRRWEIDTAAKCLRLWADSPSDFWQRTHYGFRADNGHLLYSLVSGSALIETQLRMLPQNQYDQAGLMIWISPSCWIKTSVEYEPEGDNQLGAVVTNAGYSDWSTQPFDRGLTSFWFRIRLENKDVIVHFSLDGRSWRQLRVAPLLERLHAEPVRCGVYACSPKAAGLKVDFDHLRIESLPLPGNLDQAGL